MLDQDRLEGYARALDFAEQQLAQWIERRPNQFPNVNDDGSWCVRPDQDSADGFLVGLMWEMHRLTGKTSWQDNAQHYGELLEERSAKSAHTCLYSHLPWFAISKDRERRAVLFQAASDLAARFHHKGRFLSETDNSNSLSMNVMMEVPVMFYAANETLDQDMARQATAHCRTTRDRLLSDDGTARRHAIFDIDAGKFADDDRPPETTAEPCHSRDLARALVGFSQAYGLTNAAEFLKVAERCGEHWLSHLPADHVPLEKLCVGEETRTSDNPKDVAAAAMAACTLFEMAEQTRTVEHAAAYRSAGFAMLDALVLLPYLVTETQDWEGILRRDGDAASGEGVLGDFFFVKGLRLGRDSNQ